MISSYIYNGKVVHKRFKPKEHFFKYRVFSLLIDLSELKKIDKEISFFSLNKFNLISFFEKDHGNRDNSDLIEWVRQNLKKNKIDTNDIKIKLLCYPRILGYVFNPLSVFYIYDKNSDLISTVAWKLDQSLEPDFSQTKVYEFKKLHGSFAKAAIIIIKYFDIICIEFYGTKN